MLSYCTRKVLNFLLLQGNNGVAVFPNLTIIGKNSISNVESQSWNFSKLSVKTKATMLNDNELSFFFFFLRKLDCFLVLSFIESRSPAPSQASGRYSSRHSHTQLRPWQQFAPRHLNLDLFPQVQWLCIYLAQKIG